MFVRARPQVNKGPPFPCWRASGRSLARGGNLDRAKAVLRIPVVGRSFFQLEINQGPTYQSRRGHRGGNGRGGEER